MARRDRDRDPGPGPAGDREREVPALLWRPLRRPIDTFIAGPVSVRNAMRVIVTATIALTIMGGVLVWILDRDDFPTLGDGLWWALQTVTTVGYGDVTPSAGVGRVIGTVVVLYSVGFLSILTASITTSFVERARRTRQGERADELTAVLERLDDIAARLDRLERRGSGADGG